MITRMKLKRPALAYTLEVFTVTRESTMMRAEYRCRLFGEVRELVEKHWRPWVSFRLEGAGGDVSFVPADYGQTDFWEASSEFERWKGISQEERHAYCAERARGLFEDAP